MTIHPITGVILNWKRPDNVRRILDGWHATGLVTEAIVVNNNPSAEFAHGWARVLNSNTDVGLLTRFAAACLARNQCVLIQDDDLELPEESLKLLQRRWLDDPRVLHGKFGRRPKPNGTYAQDMLGDAHAPIVLTRVLMMQRFLAGEFFRHLHIFEDLLAAGKPYGNGEDIAMSYVARQHSGSLNRIWRFPVKELPAPHAIHGRVAGHIAHRTKVLQRGEAWIKGELSGSGQ